MDILNWLVQNGRDVGTGVILAVLIVDKVISPFIRWLQSGNDTTRAAIEAHSKESEGDNKTMNSLIGFIGKLTDTASKLTDNVGKLTENLRELTELNRNQVALLTEIKSTTEATHNEVKRMPDTVMLRVNAALLDRVTALEREIQELKLAQQRTNDGMKKAFIKTNENLGKVARLIVFPTTEKKKDVA